MTLDPFKHIDPFGTVAMPLLLYFGTQGAFTFGYAKPVPVDFGALRSPRLHSALVAFAGPAANLVMALGWLILATILLNHSGRGDFLHEVSIAGVKVNLLMFAFNLIPILPLDGGRILNSMLPRQLAYRFSQLERYGFIIVLALVFMRMLDFWIIGLQNIALQVLQVVALPLQLLFR
ncbi:site-2 protease family protein [Massilia consociata]|uniref:Site-2 protease family protein n=2 Tax=Massilia consociata TaxID=760117 RepID=A0ABV6FHJ6_9BURK